MKTILSFFKYYANCWRVLFIELAFVLKLKKRPNPYDLQEKQLDELVANMEIWLKNTQDAALEMGIIDDMGLLTPSARRLAIKECLITENGVLTAKAHKIIGNKKSTNFKDENLN